MIALSSEKQILIGNFLKKFTCSLFILFSFVVAAQAQSSLPNKDTDIKTIQMELTKSNEQAHQLEKMLHKIEEANAKLQLEQATFVNDLSKAKDKIDAVSWTTASVELQILGVVLTCGSIFLSLLGFGLYKALSAMLETKVNKSVTAEEKRLKKSLEEFENKLKTSLASHLAESKQNVKSMIDALHIQVATHFFVSVSHTFWQQYAVMKAENIDNDTHNNEKRRHLNSAIQLSQRAVAKLETFIKVAPKLNEEEPLQDASQLKDQTALLFEIAVAKSNTAYYLAERCDSENNLSEMDKVEAVKLAKEARKILIKDMTQIAENNFWRECLESCCWVFTICGNTLEKIEALDLIKEICNEHEIDLEWRKVVWAKYFPAYDFPNANPPVKGD